MEIKNINKKAGIRDAFLIVALGIFCLVGLFGFLTKNANDAGISLPANYTSDYDKLVEQQNVIDSQMQDIRNAAGGVQESSLGDYAFFGLKGIWALMSLPLKFINVATNSLSLALDFVPVPKPIKVAIELGILIIIVFAIVAFMTSRGKEP